jgi:hypothetical protein
MTTELVPAAAGDTYDHLGLRLRLRLTRRETAGSIALIEHVGRSGAGTPLHRHTREAETFFVTDGTPNDPDAELPSVPGPPPPEAVERLVQILSDYGVAITGPPPTP